MKLTKREIIMLVLLLIIAVSFAEFQFIIRPGIDRYWELTEKNVELDDQISVINLNLATAERLRTQRDENLQEIKQYHVVFLDRLQPSVLLYYTYDLMDRNGFFPNSYSISPLSVVVPNAEFVTIREISYELERMIRDYKQLRIEDSEDENGQNEGIGANISEIELVEFMIVGNGTYEQLKTLLDDIRDQARTVLVSNVNMRSGAENTIDFEIMIQYYGVAKFEPDSDEYTTWPRPSFEGGIDDPFFVEEIIETDIPEEEIEEETAE